MFKKKMDKKPQTSSVYLYCIENDKIYNNIKDLQKEFKVNPKTVRKSIYKHESCKGHIFIVI